MTRTSVLKYPVQKKVFFIPEPQKASVATAHSHFHGDKLFIKVNGHESH